MSWSYNPATSAVSTTYAVTTQAMEGTQTGFLMALYPHQYTSLAGGANTAYSYISDRGKMNVNSDTSFTTTDTYHGTLLFLPPAGGYSAATLKGLIDNIAGEADHFSGNDTYGLGKQFGRIAELMPLAKTVNDTNALSNFKSTLEAKMQTWFTAGGDKTSDLFSLDPNWNSYIGYPASYGSNNSLNDHHLLHHERNNTDYLFDFLYRTNQGGCVRDDPGDRNRFRIVTECGWFSRIHDLHRSRGGQGAVSYGSGFTGSTLRLNGSAKLNGARLQLTSTTSQAGTAYSPLPVTVQSFTNDFTFQITHPSGDGMTFVIQNAGPTAVGGGGGNLGYGGMKPSVAIKFDLYNGAGEGINSTGIYTNGAAPTVPAIDLTPSGVNLHSLDQIKAHMVYDGTTLTGTLIDLATHATATQTYTVNIPSVVGASSFQRRSEVRSVQQWWRGWEFDWFVHRRHPAYGTLHGLDRHRHRSA